MPEVLFYSSPQKVIDYTGVTPADLGLRDDEESGEGWQSAYEKLFDIIGEWLEEVTDLINQDRNRDYRLEETIPPGIHNIAKRMVANMVAQAVLRRDTPLVKIDDFNVQMVEDKIFTDAIKADLSRYPAKAKFKITRVRSNSEVLSGD